MTTDRPTPPRPRRAAHAPAAGPVTAAPTGQQSAPVTYAPQHETALPGPVPQPPQAQTDGGSRAARRADAAAKKKAKRDAKADRKKTAKKDKAAAPTRASSADIPESLRQVPAPGGRYKGGRGKHVAIKTTAFITGSLLALGAATAFGAWAADALREPPIMEITTADQERFGLDTFPIVEASAFAQRYVDLCLTTPTTDEQRTARTTQIKALATTGVVQNCGVDANAPKVDVTSTAFTGVTGKVPGREDSARFIGVQATLSDGRTLNLTVPVWTDPAAPGTTFMVVGALGNNPLPAVTEVPAVTGRSNDTQLANALTKDLFPEFFAAWGQSNTTVLARFADASASPAVVTGMAGALGEATVVRTTVVLPEGESSHDWQDGDVTTAQVEVQWVLPGADGGNVFTYRVDVVMSAGGWYVRDIAGGGIDQSGATPTDPTAAVPGATTEDLDGAQEETEDSNANGDGADPDAG